jgi:hypothetical protein
MGWMAAAVSFISQIFLISPRALPLSAKTPSHPVLNDPMAGERATFLFLSETHPAGAYSRQRPRQLTTPYWLPCGCGFTAVYPYLGVIFAGKSSAQQIVLPEVWR